MLNLLIFIFATSGLTLILTKSLLFKSLREYVSSKDIRVPVNAQNPYKLKSVSNLWWFLASIMNCSMCCGLWVSIPFYCIIYGLNLSLILFVFIGSLSAFIIESIVEYLNRK